MRGPSAAGKGAVASFKRDLLRNLLRGLRARSFDAMSLQERKRAVKCSADVAMAKARGAAAGGARARWPKAVLAAAAAAASSSSSPAATCEARRSRLKRVVVRRCVGAKRVRRGCYAAAKNAAAAASSDVARRLVRRRTMALRKVIPGGDAARDEAALLREAVDYVVHLRAQVDVLRRVSAAAAAVQRSAILRYIHVLHTCCIF